MHSTGYEKKSIAVIFLAYNILRFTSTLSCFTLQAVLVEIQEAGWKQCEKLDNKSMIKEDEIRVLFDMIDKDGSGSLTKRVNKPKWPKCCMKRL